METKYNVNLDEHGTVNRSVKLGLEQWGMTTRFKRRSTGGIRCQGAYSGNGISFESFGMFVLSDDARKTGDADD